MDYNCNSKNYNTDIISYKKSFIIKIALKLGLEKNIFDFYIGQTILF